MDADKSWCNRVTFGEFQTGKDSKRFIWPWLKQKLLSAPFQTGIQLRSRTLHHKTQRAKHRPYTLRSTSGQTWPRRQQVLREMKIPFHRPGFRKKNMIFVRFLWFFTALFGKLPPTKKIRHFILTQQKTVAKKHHRIKLLSFQTHDLDSCNAVDSLHTLVSPTEPWSLRKPHRKPHGDFEKNLGWNI